MISQEKLILDFKDHRILANYQNETIKFDRKNKTEIPATVFFYLANLLTSNTAFLTNFLKVDHIFRLDASEKDPSVLIRIEDVAISKSCNLGHIILKVRNTVSLDLSLELIYEIVDRYESHRCLEKTISTGKALELFAEYERTNQRRYLEEPPSNYDAAKELAKLIPRGGVYRLSSHSKVNPIYLNSNFGLRLVKDFFLYVHNSWVYLPTENFRVVPFCTSIKPTFGFIYARDMSLELVEGVTSEKVPIDYLRSSKKPRIELSKIFN